MRMLFVLCLAPLVLAACSATAPDGSYGPGDEWRTVAGLGGACGGMMGIACEGEADGINYCRYDPSAQCGAADQMGVCTVRPTISTREYQPVCGCDGETYGNASTAAVAGVSVVHDGQCLPHNIVLF